MIDYEDDDNEEEIFYPFKVKSIVVKIPPKYVSWTDNLREVTLNFSENEKVTILGETYIVKKVRRIPEDCFCVYRLDPEFHVATFDRLTVTKSVTDHFLRNAGLIRAAVYKTSFPAVLAYISKHNDLIHPKCLLGQDRTVTTIGTKCRLKDDDRCSVCKRPFV